MIALTAGLTLIRGNNAFAEDPPQLAVFVMNVDGSELRKVAQAPDRRLHGAPTWSNDGKRVLFHAHLKDADNCGQSFVHGQRRWIRTEGSWCGSFRILVA